jgi:hypothetical protein
MVAVAFGVALIWFAVSWQPSRTAEEPEPEPSNPLVLAPAGRPAPAAPAAPTAPAAHVPEAPASAAPTTEPTPSTEPSADPNPRIRTPERSGPVDELKQLFGSEPRASGAASVEATIEAPFRRPEVPAGLLKSVICRTTVCKVETRWTPAGAQGFMASVMRLVMPPTGEPAAIDRNLGISPEGEASPDGSRAIDVYLRRSAALAPEQPTQR